MLSDCVRKQLCLERFWIATLEEEWKAGRHREKRRNNCLNMGTFSDSGSWKTSWCCTELWIRKVQHIVVWQMKKRGIERSSNHGYHTPGQSLHEVGMNVWLSAWESYRNCWTWPLQYWHRKGAEGGGTIQTLLPSVYWASKAKYVLKSITNGACDKNRKHASSFKL